MVQKQTLIGAIVISLFVGFIGGTIYTSFKLASDKPNQKQSKMTKGQNASSEDDYAKEDQSAEVLSEILKLEQYLKANPEDFKAWTNLGNLFFDSNRIKNAIDAYEKSLEIKPGNIMVITDLGVMYRRNKQPQKAIEAFNKAISIDSSFETARFNKGIVLLHDLNDIEGGIKAWEELVAQNPMAKAPNGGTVDALVKRMKEQMTKSQ